MATGIDDTLVKYAPGEEPRVRSNLMRLHRAWLNQSVTLPHIIAAEIEQRKRMQQIAEIGRLSRYEVGPLTSPPADRAEASAMEREVS